MKSRWLAVVVAAAFLLMGNLLRAGRAGADEIRGLLSMSSKPFPTPEGTVSIPLPGGDFETAGQIPPDWHIGGGKVVSSDAPQGKSCCYFNAQRGALLSPEGIAARPGGPYFISWWLKSPVETTATINFTSDERDPSFHSNVTPVPATGNQWRHVGYYFLMPVPCKTIQFQIRGPGKEASPEQLVGVDDIQLRTATEAEMAAAYAAQREQLPPRDIAPRPGDGENLALSVAKWEGRAGIPGKPFLIWAIGSSWTRGQGDGYGLIRAIRQRFPAAPPIIYKRQVEPGMPWDFAFGWVRQFVAAQQPDLIFTYTMGTPEGLDGLLTEIRRHTTADIIVPSIHFVKASTLTPDDVENGVAPWDQVRAICRKHGAEFVDNRRELAEYLKRTGVKPTQLLADLVHQNYLGRMLVWDNISRHIAKPDHFSYAPESRERRITVAPPAQTATEQVSLLGDWVTASGAVRADKAGARLKVRFTGNRIDVLGRKVPGGGSVKIFIDDKAAEEAPVFYCNFIQFKHRSPAEKSSLAAPHAVDLGKNIVPQTWTIVVTNDKGDYRVEGSVTGPDGEGNVGRPFVSKSGQIGIDPKHWRAAKFETKNHKPLYANRSGDTFTFDVYRCARGELSFQADKAESFAEPLVQNLPNGEHTLEIVTAVDGNVTIEGVYVYQPPGNELIKTHFGKGHLGRGIHGPHKLRFSQPDGQSRGEVCMPAILMVLASMISLASPVDAATPNAAGPGYAIRPVPFTMVHLDAGFWGERTKTNREVTIGYDFQKCEETGRISNFAKAAGLMAGNFEGIPFNDSDVYKVIEGAAYSLATHPDPKLDRYLDALIAKIAAAQEPDGYLYTARQLLPPEKMPRMSGKARWSNLGASHELYCAGHLYEAAVAHYQATGKRSLLEVAIKNADLIAKVFNPTAAGLHEPPGHEEIEIGLVKLYRVTGAKKYLDQARFFIDQRGRSEGHHLRGPSQQDHQPLVEQQEAVGHAVRAGYLYAGTADVAALTGDARLVQAIDRIWNDVVGRKMYLTGGIGARAKGEAFGAAYELPNASAYNETCAAIANALWNQRMFLLHGDAKYVDVLERVIYNGFLSGVSLEGDRFFYPNPLASRGNVQRSPWFDCSCCPVNVVRFVPSLPGYLYATTGERIYVNLYAQSSANIQLGGQTVQLTQATQYPWDGRVRITVAPTKAGRFSICLRIPGWAQGHPVPSDLYRYLDATPAPVTISVNGKPLSVPLEQGFAPVTRQWQAGDVIDLNLPMPIRRVVARDAVTDDAGRVALERGPLVFCLEGVDHGGKALNIALSDDALLTAERRPDLLRGVTVLRGQGLAAVRKEDGSGPRKPIQLTAIPYYAWCHRGVGEMTVFIPRDVKDAEMPRPLH